MSRYWIKQIWHYAVKNKAKICLQKINCFTEITDFLYIFFSVTLTLRVEWKHKYNLSAVKSFNKDILNDML